MKNGMGSSKSGGFGGKMQTGKGSMMKSGGKTTGFSSKIGKGMKSLGKNMSPAAGKC
jgi:hypothetical protein